jgi:predicted CoA-binding protein
MKNPTNSEIKKILTESKSIAVVGASNKPERDSYRIMQYLIEAGYNVIPVNPAYPQVLGKNCYPDLRQIEESIDIVDIFRRSEDVLPIVQDAAIINAKTIWMQIGVQNEEAAQLALRAGLKVVMNRCIMVEHRTLMHD